MLELKLREDVMNWIKEFASARYLSDKEKAERAEMISQIETGTDEGIAFYAYMANAYDRMIQQKKESKERLSKQFYKEDLSN